MLAGKLAFVTGAGSGIGRATCKALAREGSKVIAADENLKRATETVSLLDGNDHSAIDLDVSQYDSVRNAFERSLDRYKKPATILINSAGITRDNFYMNLTEMDFDKVLDVNLKGTFLVNQAGIGQMLEFDTTKGSAVVNVGSIVSKAGNVGQSNYVASKAGVEALTKVASMEFGKFGIRVNAVLPGMIDTEMTKSMPEKVEKMFISRISLGRKGKAEEVAELILFLASDKSSYVNGALVEVTGGLH